MLFEIPVVFVLFGATLVGVLLLHRRSLEVSLVGLSAIVGVRLGFSRFDFGQHLGHEWMKLANLFGLLLGFTLLADHLERSHLPRLLPRALPRGALGCFALLISVWLLSGLLDNIAAALIGATAAAALFKRQVHLGYLAAIVAAANAGGAGSVLGDTTTTMLWLDGISPLVILPAYLGAASALVVFGAFASVQQNKHRSIMTRDTTRVHVDAPRLAIVVAALGLMVCVNLLVHEVAPVNGPGFPSLALALWLVLLAGAPVRSPNWRLLHGALRSSVFLVALILAASLMPVEALPRPSWLTTLTLGFVSSFFDNIPLTKLALDQGGYDWALLAYSVGLGGSMLWFGSSAGVAVAGLFPEAKSVTSWIRAAWHIPVGFVIGFVALCASRGWRP
jgi:Na+/H+ antiporter NhaD/arsenite permease-like protein